MRRNRVLHQDHDQDRQDQREHRVEAEIFVVVQEHHADAALGAGDALDHGQQHPAHSGVFAHHIDDGVGLAAHHDFPDDAPFAHAERAGMVILFHRNAIELRQHRGHEPDQHAIYQQRQLELVDASGRKREEDGQADEADGAVLGDEDNERPDDRHQRRIDEQQRQDRGEEDRFDIEQEADHAAHAAGRAP